MSIEKINWRALVGQILWDYQLRDATIVTDEDGRKLPERLEHELKQAFLRGEKSKGISRSQVRFAYDSLGMVSQIVQSIEECESQRIAIRCISELRDHMKSVLLSIPEKY